MTMTDRQSHANGDPKLGSPSFEQRIYAPQSIAAIVAELAEQQHDAEEVLEGTHLAPAQLEIHTTKISYKQLDLVIRNALRLSREPGFALRAGLRMHVTAYGMYGYGLLSSGSHSEAREFAAKYIRIVGPFCDFTVSNGATTIAVTFKPMHWPDPTNDIHRFAVEFALAGGDRVISLSILHHFEATPAERAAYLKQSGAIRRAATGEDIEPEEATPEADEAAHTDLSLPEGRYVEMGAAEQFVLTVTAQGYGKRSSSFEFRVSGRGGKGIRASDPTKIGEIGHLVAGFPVEMSDQIMLVSDGGQLIRVPVEGIRITSRASKGVRVFNTADDEHVVSVEHIREENENGNGG